MSRADFQRGMESVSYLKMKHSDWKLPAQLGSNNGNKLWPYHRGFPFQPPS